MGQTNSSCNIEFMWYITLSICMLLIQHNSFSFSAYNKPPIIMHTSPSVCHYYAFFHHRPSARRCPPINGFENGYVFEGTRLPGSTNVFSCYPSHVLVGARFIRCQSNWTWDNTAPSCGECMHSVCKQHCMH